MLLVAGSPLMLVITSSGRNPAVAAGPPGDTAWTNSPSGTPAWAAAAGGIGVVCTPKKAWVTRPVAMISSAMDLARSTGMAKPSPMLPPPDWPEGLAGSLDFEHGEIGLRVPAGDRGGLGVAVGELHLDRTTAGGGYRDDVIVRQDVAV